MLHTVHVRPTMQTALMLALGLTAVLPLPCPAQDMASVTGVVVDEEGGPIEGARVWMLRIKDGPLDPFAPDIDVRTGADGRFGGILAPGTYLAFYRKGMLTSTRWDRSTARIQVEAGDALGDLRVVLVPGVLVRGRVLRQADKLPIGGARVVCDDGLAAVTDRRGGFELAGVTFGAHELQVTAPGYGDTRVRFNTAGQPECEVRAELQPGFVIRGQVVDEDGAPVTGATVRGPRQDRSLLSHIREAVTDEEGAYEIGSYNLDTEEVVLLASHPAFARRSLTVAPPQKGSAQATARFILGKGFAVEGFVYGLDGESLKGATVRYGRAGEDVDYRTALTDAKGAFRLDRIATDGEEDIVAHAKGYAPASQKATPGKGTDTPELTFKLEPGVVASGRVVDEAGKPIAGARIHTRMAGALYFGRPVRTDGEGRFRIDSLPRQGATVDIQARGHSPLRGYALDMAAETEIVLAPSGAIAGKVLDHETGRPVAQFNVTLRAAEQDVAATTQQCISPRGAFTLSGLTYHAPYTVTVSAEGYLPKRVDSVIAAVETSDKWPLVVALGQGDTLWGRVVDAQWGVPLPNATVTLVMSRVEPVAPVSEALLAGASRHGHESHTAHTDADGAFQFKGVPENLDRAVVATRQGYAPHVITDCTPENLQRIALERPGEIAGTVVGYPQVVPTSACVSALSPVWSAATHPVEADGSFRLTGLPPGSYRVLLYGKPDPREVRRVVYVPVRARDTTTMDFGNLPGTTVRGTVRLGDKPLPGATVNVWDASSGKWIAAETTDAEGAYTVPGILPGEYYIDAGGGSANGGTGARRLVTADELGEPVDLRLGPGRITGRIVDSVTGLPLKGTHITAKPVCTDALGCDRALSTRVESSVEKMRIALGPMNYSPSLLGLRATRTLKDPTSELGRAMARTDAEGSFSIAGLQPGPHVLLFRGPRGPAPNCVTVSVPDEGDMTAQVNLSLNQSAHVKLRLIDRDTRMPIEGARLHLHTSQGVHLASSAPTVPLPAAPGVAVPWGPIQTDAQGRVTLDDLRPGDYGAWVAAPGYGARWIAPLKATAQEAEDEEVLVRLRPTSILSLEPDAEVLESLYGPYLTYEVLDAAGEPVYPGAASGMPLRAGAVPLIGENADLVQIKVLPPGEYTLRWEIHCTPGEDDGSRGTLQPAVCRGEAAFELTKDIGAFVTLEAQPELEPQP